MCTYLHTCVHADCGRDVCDVCDVWVQYYISRSIPYQELVITHVIETLVFVPVMIGMMFFLFEFFQDQMVSCVQRIDGT
jgi:hypothetical protein